MQKSFSRMSACLLAVCLLVGLFGAASAGVSLPGGLTVLEEEAFMGSALDGLVRVPAGVTTVEKDAFSGTNIYALELPATVRTLNAQSMSNLAYLKVESRSATLTGVPSSVKFITAPKGGMVQYYANAQHIDFVPIDSLIAQDGFYYIPNDNGVTLLAAIDNSELLSAVTIPENVDGKWVTAVSDYAFVGCGQVSSIDLPVAVQGHVPSGALAGSGCNLPPIMATAR